MLFTPLLPEAASGTLEPRHVVVPLRVMCPHAELLLGPPDRARSASRRSRQSWPERTPTHSATRTPCSRSAHSRASLPIPGLAEHGLGFKDLADAIHLRNHVLRQLEAAAAERDRQRAEAHLTFVFVGAGYAGVEALAELSDLVRDAMRYYPEFQRPRARWVLVDAAPKILPEIPSRLGDYAAKQLTDRGVEIHTSTTLASVGPGHGRALGRAAHRRPHARLDGGRQAEPGPARARPADRRARRGSRRLDAEGRRARRPLGARRLRARAERAHAGAAGPADVTARFAPGPPVREESARRREALRVQDARPGGHPRALQGDRARLRPAAPRASSAGS